MALKYVWYFTGKVQPCKHMFCQRPCIKTVLLHVLHPVSNAFVTLWTAVCRQGNWPKCKPQKQWGDIPVRWEKRWEWGGSGWEGVLVLQALRNFFFHRLNSEIVFLPEGPPLETVNLRRLHLPERSNGVPWGITLCSCYRYRGHGLHLHCMLKKGCLTLFENTLNIFSDCADSNLPSSTR